MSGGAVAGTQFPADRRPVAGQDAVNGRAVILQISGGQEAPTSGFRPFAGLDTLLRKRSTASDRISDCIRSIESAENPWAGHAVKIGEGTLHR